MAAGAVGAAVGLGLLLCGLVVGAAAALRRRWHTADEATPSGEGISVSAGRSTEVVAEAALDAGAPRVGIEAEVSPIKQEAPTPQSTRGSLWRKGRSTPSPGHTHIIHSKLPFVPVSVDTAHPSGLIGIAAVPASPTSSWDKRPPVLRPTVP